MKHAWKKLLAAAVLPCLLAGCGALGGPESEVPSMDHLLGLTQEQRLEDYDYLVQTLGDSYLCMGVRDRDNPEDPSAAIFQAYREMIQESDSDEVFYSAVYSTLFRLGTYGHLWIVEPDMYRAYCEAYEDGGIQDREHWREVLTDPVTVRGYERLQTLLDAYGEEDGTVNSADSEEPAANLHTLLLPGGDVGYVKIDSFPAEYEDSYATDRAALTDFYRQAADCTDLIIDLTDNSGGSEVYWQQLLAAPLTDRPLSCTNYALLAESDNNRPYIQEVFSPEELHPIADLPDLPKLERDTSPLLPGSPSVAPSESICFLNHQINEARRTDHGNQDTDRKLRMRDDHAAKTIYHDKEDRSHKRCDRKQSLVIRSREHANDMRDDQSDKADHPG